MSKKAKVVNASGSSFLEEKDFQQAEVYAKELSELYRAERKRREELAEERLVLQHKLRELTALNNLFHAHLEERMRIEQEYREFLEKLKKMLAEASSRNLAKKLTELLADVEARLSRPQI